MDTQETPTNQHLWHRSFGLLAAANFFLTVSVYMLIPSLSEWLLQQFTPLQTGLIMGSYGLGLFVLGPYCSFLVQHYRRNQVCILAIFVIALLTLLTYLCKENHAEWQASVWVFVGVRFLYGAAFGVAQMVLCSTLVIDSCESFQRTQANYIMSWFGRIGVGMGPLIVMLTGLWLEIDIFLVIAGVASFSLLLIMMVRFPFKAPEDTQLRASLDRFFLTGAWPLFLNMVLVTVFVGIVLASVHTIMFYVMMLCGFLMAILFEQVLLKYPIRNSILAGLSLMFLSLMFAGNGNQFLNTYFFPVCLGLGSGIVGSGFLLSFVKLSDHCQRGTSQSTFFLSWELGVSIGLFLGFAFLAPHHGSMCFHDMEQACAFPQLGIKLGTVFLLISFFFYVFFTYPWYVRHRNR